MVGLYMELIPRIEQIQYRDGFKMGVSNLIIAPMGLGKTLIISLIITTYFPNKKVLVLSDRRSLALQLQENFSNSTFILAEKKELEMNNVFDFEPLNLLPGILTNIHSAFFWQIAIKIGLEKTLCYSTYKDMYFWDMKKVHRFPVPNKRKRDSPAMDSPCVVDWFCIVVSASVHPQERRAGKHICYSNGFIQSNAGGHHRRGRCRRGWIAEQGRTRNWHRLS